MSNNNNNKTSSHNILLFKTTRKSYEKSNHLETYQFASLANFFLSLCLFSLHLFWCLSIYSLTHTHIHTIPWIHSQHEYENWKWFEGFSMEAKLSSFQEEWLCARKTGIITSLAPWFLSNPSNRFLLMSNVETVTSNME